MTIMASAPVPIQCRLDEAKTVRLHPMTAGKPSCPPWCSWDSPDDGEGTFSHFSDLAFVHPTAGGEAERDPIEVSVDQDAATEDGTLGAARVVVSNLGPLTPGEALELAGLLVAAAHRVDPSCWRETERWARELVDDPTADPRHREIVADLLSQVEGETR